MDLRDRFACSFAKALVTQGALLSAAELAQRSYDLAEALLAERAHRIEADERAAFYGEPAAFDDELAPASLHLLEDAPPAPDDDLREEALAGWLDARASDELDLSTGAPRSAGPGLAKASTTAREPAAGRDGERTGS